MLDSEDKESTPPAPIDVHRCINSDGLRTGIVVGDRSGEDKESSTMRDVLYGDVTAVTGYVLRRLRENGESLRGIAELRAQGRVWNSKCPEA